MNALVAGNLAEWPRRGWTKNHRTTRGINDLRQGDAHAGEPKARAALKIFEIPDETEEFQRMNLCITGRIVMDDGSNSQKF